MPRAWRLSFTCCHSEGRTGWRLLWIPAKPMCRLEGRGRVCRTDHSSPTPTPALPQGLSLSLLSTLLCSQWEGMGEGSQGTGQGIQAEQGKKTLTAPEAQWGPAIQVLVNLKFGYCGKP